jgi:tetratricopeptide (TPR) repeat protein
VRALTLGLTLGLLAPARADTVLLKDGREIEGTVVEETPMLVRVRVSRGTGTAVVELQRAEVRLVTKKGADTRKLAKDADEALATGHRDDAIRIMKNLVDANPGDARARRDLAFAELLDEQVERARDDYARAAALDPGDVESFIGLGYASARTGEKEAAIDAYRKATTIAPRHVRPWLALAQLLLERNQRGDREDAVVAGRHALEAAPDSSEAALLEADAMARAQGLGAADDRRAALDLLEKFLGAHARATGAVRVARRAADLAFGAGDPARARAAIVNLIAAGPQVTAEDRERLLALEALYGWFAEGRSEPVLGLDPSSERLDVDAALRRVDLALEAVPAEGALLLSRARLLARKGKAAEALEAAQSADVALPAGGAAKKDALLLRTFLDTSKKDESTFAEKDARRLVELLPSSFGAHEALARSLEAAGSLAEARDGMRIAASLAPESEKKRLSDEADRIEAARIKREKNKDL